MTTSTSTREWHLAARPHGLPTAETYALVDRELPPLRHGQFLVRNLVLSVDPYMRPRMNDARSYVPPFEVGKPLLGAAVGEVVETRDAEVPVGTWVVHHAGWREHAVLSAKAVRVVEASAHPSSYHLGVLGMPSFTAFVGLFHVAGLQPGESVFVSGAAGAVGSMVGQFASLAGAERVVGSAGSAEKVAYLTDELGYDAAFDYKSGAVVDQLRNAFPDGFEVYFDNVGSEHLAAALEVVNDYGRMAMCGTISTYNSPDRRTTLGDTFKIVSKRLRLLGFIVSDHEDLRAEFVETVGTWLDTGRLVYRETVSQGIESVPDTFAGMLTGANTGKAIIRLSPDPV